MLITVLLAVVGFIVGFRILGKEEYLKMRLIYGIVIAAIGVGAGSILSLSLARCVQKMQWQLVEKVELYGRGGGEGPDRLYRPGGEQLKLDGDTVVYQDETRPRVEVYGRFATFGKYANLEPWILLKPPYPNATRYELHLSSAMLKRGVELN